jgi:hypothetical protein
MLEHSEDIVLTYPSILLMLLELDLEQMEQVLVAVDLVLALGTVPEQHLVAAAVVEVVADLHYSAADSHQALVLCSADLEVD